MKKTLKDKLSDKLVNAFLKNKIVTAIPNKFTKKLTEADKFRKLCESKIKEPVIGYKAGGTGIPLLKKLKEKSVDMIFADPPYNLSGKKHLTVKSGKPVQGFKGDWDVVKNNAEFSEEWITECIRVLKDDGTIWISGTLHNHPIIGVTLKKLGLWILNDVIWFKPNATPLLQTTRPAPSVELIWLAAKSKKYY